MASAWAKSDECSKCKKNFNITRRRHHCRKCSQSICSDCSAKEKLTVQGFQGPQLVCEDCAKAPPEAKQTVPPAEVRGNCPICKKPVTTDHERFRRPDTNEYIHFSCQSSVATPTAALAKPVQQTEQRLEKPQSDEEDEKAEAIRLKEEKARADALREAEEEDEREATKLAEQKRQAEAARAAEEALRTSQAQLALAARMAEDARRAEEARKTEPALGSSFTKPHVMVHLPESSTPSGPRPGTPRADSPIPDLTLDQSNSSSRGSLTTSPPLERSLSRRASFSVTPTKTPDGSRPSTPRPVSPVRSLKEKTPLEVAATTVRSLKASVAPLADVASAIQAYLAIELNSAADHVRVLKAQGAPEAEVRAAIRAYSALELQDAADRVRLLKEQSGEPEELRTAEEVCRALKREFLPLEAMADHIRELKLRMAPVTEVKIAVENYLTLELNATAERGRTLQEGKGASQSEIEAVARRQNALREEIGGLCNAALNSIARRVAELKASGTAEAVEAYGRAELEVAAEHIRTLKAQAAPRDALEAAVEAYSALEGLLKCGEEQPVAQTSNKLEEPATTNQDGLPQVAPAQEEARTTERQPASAHEEAAPAQAEKQAQEPTKKEAESQPQEPTQEENQPQEPTQEEPKSQPQEPAQDERQAQEPTQEEASPARDSQEAKAAQSEHTVTQPTQNEPTVLQPQNEPTHTDESPVEAQQTPANQGLADDIRALKARNAPEADVRRAILALQQVEIADASQRLQTFRSLNSPQDQIEEAEAILKELEAERETTQSDSLEQAATRIRLLKAKGAPLAEVKAAVDAYSALEPPSDVPQVTMHLPTSDNQEQTLVFQ